MEAIILAGGLGTRLRSVCPNLPKPLAPVHNKPFLSYLMSYWKNQGVTHFILSVGYLYEKVIDTYGKAFEDIPIDYAIEKTPLGTGGALLHALPYLHNPKSPFLALNGDTFFQIPLKEFALNGDCMLALYHAEKNTRYDGIILSDKGQVVKLGDQASSLINGGCYLFQKTLFADFKAGPLSLEKELLPTLIHQGRCFGKAFEKPFIDIGIPKDYQHFITLYSTKSH